MKNIFRFLMAVALLFTASCAKEDISSSIAGGEVEVTFTANLPELGTRAFGEGKLAKQLTVNVYEHGTNEALTALDRTVTSNTGVFTFQLVLLKGMKYDIVLWAQDPTCGHYTLTNKVVTMNYTGVNANDESRDAFYYYVQGFDPAVDTPSFALTRPFAQLNAAVNQSDMTAVSNSKVELTTSTVKVKTYTTLNIATGEVGGETEVEFEPTAMPQTDFNGYKLLSMNYILVPQDAVNAKMVSDVEFTFKANKNGSESAFSGTKYYNVPLKRNYRTNILGALLTKPTDFTVTIDPVFGEPAEDLDAETQIFNVSSQAEFEDALGKAAGQNHIQHLVINLNADVTLDVTAWQTLAIGNKNTKDITINGSKSRAAGEYYTLTFNHKSSDWNNIVTNGAKLILESLNITNSGYNNGPWNRHDLNFACEVEMNNVVSDKALALKAGATLKNTTITEDNTSDVYAIWIQPNGQTVTIDNCTIDSTAATDGRGIKIDEQYVDSPKKVILNVSNTTFKTEEKSAILVKSVAGAEINLSNLDITNVAADSVYAVWVDEASAAYYDLVEVTGAKVRLEGSAIVTNQAEFNAAVAAGKAQINLAAGTYTLPDNAKGTIIGTDKAGCVVKITKSHYGDNVATLTLQNLTTQIDAGYAYTEQAFAYFHHYKEVNIINCNADRIRLDSSKANIEGCTFTLTTSGGFDGYAIFHYGNNNSTVNVKDCVFDTAGKAIVIYNEGAIAMNMNVDGCTFTSSNASTDKAAIQMHTERGISGVLKINDCTANGFADINNGLWNELNNLTGVLTNVFEKYVDDVQVYNELALVDGAYTIYSAAGLQKFANEVNVNGNSFADKTVKLANDIDLNNAVWTPVGQTGATQFQGTFDGNGKTIYNLNIDKTSETGKYYSSGLFGWLNAAKVKNVTVNGATVKGNHNVGVIAGYLETAGCTIENCHVIGAAVECHHANDDACGDKCGGVVGHAGNAGVAVKDCTVADSTVKAGRDAGQVVGAALAVNVTGCSATNVTVEALAGCTDSNAGGNIRNEVIGRLL